MPDTTTTVVVTTFPSFAAVSKREQTIELTELARRIQTTSATHKHQLPWLKLCKFGDRRTEKHSLRHDANVLAVTGLEADFDGGVRITFDQALARLRIAGILAIAYTSPSHRDDAPRWRVLAPFSTEYPPHERDRFMARLHGLFGGVFALESWTLSQSYFYGAVDRNPAHRVQLVDGTPIDLASALDAIAIGRPVKPEGKAPANGAAKLHGTAPAEISDRRVAALIEQLLGNVRAATDGAKHVTLRSNGISLGGYLHLVGWSEAEAIEQLIEALPSAKDWNLARKTAAWAVSQGVLRPQTLPDRPREGRWSA